MKTETCWKCGVTLEPDAKGEYTWILQGGKGAVPVCDSCLKDYLRWCEEMRKKHPELKLRPADPKEHLAMNSKEVAPMDQKPSIGRIVHVTTHPHEEAGFPSVVRPAIITEVYSETTVALQVFYKKGIQTWDSVPFSAEAKPGCWSWPPRV